MKIWLMLAVTLLSIFACDNIAVPLSSGFPASELRYILENSEAVTLVSSRKFEDKAAEVLREGLDHLPSKPDLSIVEKRRHGSGQDEVQLVPLPMNKGGMMLYTSGTTSRPVCIPPTYSLRHAYSFRRRVYYCQQACSQLKRNRSTKPGSIRRKIISCTCFLFITSTARSMHS